MEIKRPEHLLERVTFRPAWPLHNKRYQLLHAIEMLPMCGSYHLYAMDLFAALDWPSKEEMEEDD